MNGLLRAVKRQIGIRINRLEAAWFDIKSGTLTRGKASAKKLGLQNDDAGPLTGYQAVNERHLRTVLETISFPPASVFVDIGCGKGKAVLIAASYPFISRAIGIELASSLCDEARRNIEILRKKKGLSKRVDIVQADATTYRFIDGENIFFANNPFDWTVMSRLVDNLFEAARLQGKDVFFLYYNPANAEALGHDPRIRLVREFQFLGPGRNLNLYLIAPASI